jgi:O-antigen/teichoic acid export membrane protein
MDFTYERNRRLRAAVFSSLLVKPIAAFTPVLVIPIFIKYLGPERYGIFETLSSVAVWIGLTSMGLGFGLNNRLINCKVSNDESTACAYVSTLFFAMLLLLAAGALTLAFLAYYLDWNEILNSSGAISKSEMQIGVLLALVIPLTSATISFAPSIYSAYQEIHKQNIWDGTAKVLALVACFSVPRIGGGIGAAIFAISGTPVLVGLVNLWYLLSRGKPWLHPRLRFWSGKLLGQLAHDGLLLFMAQSCAIVLFQSDRFLIGLLRTPGEVAQYGILNRCFLLFYGAYYLLLAPLWPAYGEAFRRGDIAWCKKKLKLTSAIGTVGMLSVGGLLTAFSVEIFSFISRGELHEIPRFAIIGMSVGFCFRAWADAHAILLNGASVLRPQVALLGANAVLSIGINIWLTKNYGVLGTVWSFPIASILTTIWGYPWLFQRYIAKPNTNKL